VPVAPARHRNLGLAHARDQGADHPEARAHFRNEVIGRRGVDDVLGGKLERLAGVFVVAGALAADHDVDAVIAEDVLQQRDVGEPRHVVEDERILGQEACDHQRKCGVLRAGDRNRSPQRPSALNPNAIHLAPRAIGAALAASLTGKPGGNKARMP